MAGKTHGDRLDRLEQVVQILAEDQVSLGKLIADLATETRIGFDRVARQFEETEERMRRTDEQMRRTDEQMREQMRRTDEQMRQTDERIGKLVLAIGELIRTQIHPTA
jgi:hypothetical protein